MSAAHDETSPGAVPEDLRDGRRRPGGRLLRADGLRALRVRAGAAAAAGRAAAGQRVPAHRQRRHASPVLLAHSEMGQGIWTDAPDAGRRGAGRRLEPQSASSTRPRRTSTHSTVFPHPDDRRLDDDVVRVRPLPPGRRRGADTAGARPRRRSGSAGRRVPHRERLRDHPATSRLSYGSLADGGGEAAGARERRAQGAGGLEVIGKPTRRLDTPEKITGTAQVRDRRPAARPADRGGGALADVRRQGQELRRDGGEGGARRARGVRGADRASPWSPTTSGRPSRGRDALKVEWDLGPHAGLDTAKLRASYREQAKTAGARGRRPARRRGEGAAATDADGRRVRRSPTSRTRRWSRSTAPCSARPTALRGLDRDAVPDRRPAARSAQIFGLEAGAGRRSTPCSSAAASAGGRTSPRTS